MTKICIISDTHGMHDAVRVPSCDILIHCGDCTNDIGQKSLREFLIWFEDQDAPSKILIAGNHDGAFEKWPDQARAMVKEFAPSVNYLQDSECNIQGLTFWGSPVTPEFFNWHFNRNRGEDIKKHWDLIPNNIDVLITHGPPLGFLDKSKNVNRDTGRMYDDHLGCRDLKEAMYRVRPLLHCFGHIHGSGGRQFDYIDDDGYKTMVVNASICNERYKPRNPPMIVNLP
jgi:Icc-related predicted phosphoesterase